MAYIPKGGGMIMKGKPKTTGSSAIPQSTVREDDMGAAGRGAYGAEDVASYMAASKSGKPMSTAPETMKGTTEYKSALSSLSSMGTLPSASTNVSLPIGKKSPTSGFASKDGTATREPLGFSTERGVDIKRKADDAFKRLSGQPDVNQFGQTGDQQAQAQKAAKEMGLPDPFAKKDEPQQKLPDDSITFVNPETQQTIKKRNPDQGDIASYKKMGFEVMEADTSSNIELDQDPEIAKLQLEVQKERQNMQSMFSQLQNSLISDKELQGQTRTIEAAWDSRIKDMEEVNRQREESMKTLGVRTGSRWTGGMGGMWGGIISAEERQGIQRIADLESKKQSKILEAQTAAQNKNWEVYVKMTDIAQDMYNEKAQELSKLQEEARKKNEEVAKQKRQSSRDMAINGLIAQNVTDENEILNMLNYDDNGNVTGDFTIKEVSEAVTAIRKPVIDAQKAAYDLALKNGAPASVIAAISTASTPEEAYAAIGEYGVDQLDRQYKKAQIANIYSSIQDRNIDNARQSAESSMEPSQLVAYAQQYAATGKIPTGLPKGTFGMVSEVAKELPKNKGELLDRKTGIKPDAADSTVNGYGALYSAIELSKQLKTLDEERLQGLIPAAFGKVFGTKAQSQYMDLRKQIVDLLARARSGAALSTSEEEHYASMLPGRVGEVAGFIGVDSDVRIDNFTSALSSDLNNKTSVQGWAINGISKVNVDGTDYTIGDVITNEAGQSGRINADGSVTLIQ